MIHDFLAAVMTHLRVVAATAVLVKVAEEEGMVVGLVTAEIHYHLRKLGSQE
jgi:hypothetical protein